MKWLNAIAMLFQFISFWLAAPEIIGDKGLKRMQDMIKNLLSNLSVIILSTLILGYTLYFTINGIITGMEASETGITSGELIEYYITLFVAMLIYVVFMIRIKPIKLWIDNNISMPLVEKYIHNDRLRRNSLFGGAFLFTAGFLIQFIIILMEP